MSPSAIASVPTPAAFLLKAEIREPLSRQIEFRAQKTMYGGRKSPPGLSSMSSLASTAAAAAIPAAVGAYLDRDDPGTGAAFGAATVAVPRALARISPKTSRISVEDAINIGLRIRRPEAEPNRAERARVRQAHGLEHV